MDLSIVFLAWGILQLLIVWISDRFDRSDRILLTVNSVCFILYAILRNM